MLCKNCPASCDNSGYEHDADDWWCGLGEDMESGYQEECGCKRRSLEKIKRDLKVETEKTNEAFAHECGEMVKYYEEQAKSNERLCGVI